MIVPMTNTEESLHQQKQREEEYNQWLQSNNVQVASHLVETTCQGTVAGWGCIATSNINKGTVLFSIPRGACFGIRSSSVGDEGGLVGIDDGSRRENGDDDDDDEGEDQTTHDTQMEMALRLLHSGRSEGEDYCWKPFLNMLTYPPNGLPWTWLSDEKFRKVILQGTELEEVVENKVERVRLEYEKIRKEQGDLDFSYEDYVNACAVVSR